MEGPADDVETDTFGELLSGSDRDPTRKYDLFRNMDEA